MFRKVLVPLDGSPESEAILPIIAQLSEDVERELTLLHVLERHPPSQVHGEPHLGTRQSAEAYLQAQVRKWGSSAGSVRTMVIEEGTQRVSDTIVAVVEQEQCNLVGLCNHGPSDLPKAIVGSLAQRLAQVLEVPVLTLRVRQLPTSCQRCGEILLPVDPQDRTDGWLELIAVLWQAWCLPVHLLAIVPTTADVAGAQAPVASLLPNATRGLLDLEADRAVEWLRSLTIEAQRQGIQTTSSLRRGGELDALRSEVESRNCPLVVLSTHAPPAWQVLLRGSLTASFLTRSSVPVLLLPAPRSAPPA
ncbi:MAG: universal stress protein [Chloroflexi bacterium]|nr:universal stress protein [Chloroflexota bacterium]